MRNGYETLPVEQNTNFMATKNNVKPRLLVAVDDTGREANGMDVRGGNLVKRTTYNPRVRFISVDNAVLLDVRGTAVERCYRGRKCVPCRTLTRKTYE